MDTNALGNDVHNVNVLTVIASESYDSFAKGLQTEMAEAVADRPRVVTADLFIGKVIKDNQGKTICIVSHGCAIMNMLCYLHGYPVEDIGKITLGTNLAISVIHFDEALRPTVIKENDAAYLQELSSRSTGIV